MTDFYIIQEIDRFVTKPLLYEKVTQGLNETYKDFSDRCLKIIKKAEKQFEIQMKELDVDIFELEVADKQNARGMFSKDWTARIIGLFPDPPPGKNLLILLCKFLTISSLFRGVGPLLNPPSPFPFPPGSPGFSSEMS